jgi:hypothetical protein
MTLRCHLGTWPHDVNLESPESGSTMLSICRDLRLGHLHAPDGKWRLQNVVGDLPSSILCRHEKQALALLATIF